MAERLCAAEDILILCHKNPDGDTIGCASALCHALEAMDKNAAVLCSDPIPERYAYTAARLFKGDFEPRTVVAVDVASIQLFGENNGMPQYTRHVDLCIDHHAGNSGYADFTLLDGGAAAAAELLYEVILAMGVSITPQIADCLYTGLSTDTGCFKYSNVTGNTLRVAAELIDLGADVAPINKIFFDTKTFARLKLEARLTAGIELYAGGMVGLCTLPQRWIDELLISEDDIDSISGFARSIEGVEIGIMIREVEGGMGKLSLRTSPRYDACALCQQLGGGGHAAAAGASVAGGIEGAKKAILDVLTQSGIRL